MLGDGLPRGRGIPYGYDIGVGTHESGDIIRLDGDGGGIGIAEAEVLGDVPFIDIYPQFAGTGKGKDGLLRSALIHVSVTK